MLSGSGGVRRERASATQRQVRRVFGVWCQLDAAAIE